MIFDMCFNHLYGYLTYSSVQVFPINWDIGGERHYIKIFAKRLKLRRNVSSARFKIKMRRARTGVIWMYLWKELDGIFISCNVSFVITAVTVETVITALQQHPLLAGLRKHCRHKWALFKTLLKLWAMHYYFKLGCYDHLVPCNRQLPYSLLWDEGGGVKYIGSKN